MSVVLCLPAHLCVSPQRPVAGPPRERVKSVSPPRAYQSLACHSGPPTPSSAAQQLAARSSQRSAAGRSAAQRLAAPPSDSAEPVTEPAAPSRASPCPRRDREGGGQTRTPSTASPIGRPARPHTQSRQPPPQPPADQHRPHSQSSAAAPASTTTTSSLSGTSAHRGPQDQVRPPLPC